MRFLFWAFAIVLGSLQLDAQPGTITTVAGAFPASNTSAERAALFYPGSIVFDRDGNLYVSEYNRILKITPDGALSNYVGTGVAGFSTDGTRARSALMSTGYDGGLAFGPDGLLYFSDPNNRRIRRVDSDGLITTVVGTGVNGNAGDGGPARSATLSQPTQIAFGPDGSLYVCDLGNHRIRRIDPQGTMRAVAGDGRAGFAGDGGPAVQASLNAPRGLAVSADGQIYIADSLNGRIRRVDATGNIRTILGTGIGGACLTASQCSLGYPSSLVLDPGGRLIFGEANQSIIRMLDNQGAISIVAGSGRRGQSAVGLPALGFDLSGTSNLAFHPAGDLCLVDSNNHRVLRVDNGGIVRLVAGADRLGGSTGPALYARLISPRGINFDPQGNLYLAEPGNALVRFLDGNGGIKTAAGNTVSGGVNEANLALNTPLRAAADVSFSPDGLLHVVFSDYDYIWRVNADGSLTRVAGRETPQGVGGFSGDGSLGPDALLRDPQGIAFDTQGNLFIADSTNNRIRRVSPDGIITTVVGNGVAGFSGDNGAAVAARLSGPAALAVGPDGSLYVADRGNNRIRQVTPDGLIRTIAGTGARGYDGDNGPAVKAQLNDPKRVALDAQGNIYVLHGNKVSRINTAGIITTVAGTGAFGLSGDGGDAKLATFNNPQGLAIAANGDIYVADFDNHRIRKIQGTAPFYTDPSTLLFTFPLVAPPSTQTVTLSSGDGQSRSFQVSVNVPWLRVTPNFGSIDPDKAATLTVTATPSLGKGRFNGRITLADPNSDYKLDIPITMLISGTPQQLQLGQTGFTFTAVQNVSQPFDQSLRVLNVGNGSMPWTASASTLSGGNWLRVSPASGTTNVGTAPPSVQVSAIPTGLAAGTYFGLVTITAPSADNAPQSAVVVLNVLPSGTPPGPVVDPTGSIVTSDVNGRPASQTITIANPSARVSSFTTTLSFADNQRWFTVSPATGALNPGQSLKITVSPSVTNIPAGSYRGDIAFRFTPDNVTKTASLILVVAPGATNSTSEKQKGLAATTSCTPKRLIPIFTSPGANFAVTAGWPERVEIKVVDDCGQAVDSGRAVVSISTGDPALNLIAIGEGRWTGTWNSRTARASGITLTAQIENSATPKLQATATIAGGVRANPEQPLIDRDGFLQLATQRRGEPVATGSLASIVGSNLADGALDAPGQPLPLDLGGTKAVIGGRAIPLRQTSAGRLETQVPWNMAENTPLQLIVQRGRSYSSPETVYLTSTSPAIYTFSGTGSDQGSVYGRTKDGQLLLADVANPVLPGQEIVLYASGLGPTDPAQATGEAASSDTLARATTPLTFTVGGKEATVTEAVLAPGQIGVYRLTANVPDGLDPSASARVTITIGGFTSPPVTVAIAAPMSPPDDPGTQTGRTREVY